MQVLLDTNIVFSDLQMQKSELRLLLERSRSGYIRLLVPEVMIREMVNKFRERLSDIERRLNRIERELDELLAVPEGARVEELDVATQVRAYERDLRQQLAAANADVLEVPRVPHNELVGRAIAKRKPFGEKDRGYRDALIWFNVLAGARSDRVAFISNNHKDFAGSDGNLAPVLQEEVDGLGYGEDRVALYSDLRAFRREYLESAPDDIRDCSKSCCATT